MNIKRKKLTAFLAGGLLGLSIAFVRFAFWEVNIPRFIEKIMDTLLLPWFFGGAYLYSGTCALSSAKNCTSEESFLGNIDLWIGGTIGQFLTSGLIFLLIYIAYSKLHKPTST